jgi:hypothetical protein
VRVKTFTGIDTVELDDQVNTWLAANRVIVRHTSTAMRPLKAPSLDGAPIMLFMPLDTWQVSEWIMVKWAFNFRARAHGRAHLAFVAAIAVGAFIFDIIIIAARVSLARPFALASNVDRADDIRSASVVGCSTSGRRFNPGPNVCHCNGCPVTRTVDATFYARYGCADEGRLRSSLRRWASMLQ